MNVKKDIDRDFKTKGDILKLKRTDIKKYSTIDNEKENQEQDLLDLNRR